MWKILLSSEENIDFFFLNKSYSLCWQWGSHIVIRDSYGKKQKVLKNCSGFFVLPLFVVTCLNNLVLAETQPSGHSSLPTLPLDAKVRSGARAWRGRAEHQLLELAPPCAFRLWCQQVLQRFPATSSGSGSHLCPLCCFVAARWSKMPPSSHAPFSFELEERTICHSE